MRRAGEQLQEALDTAELAFGGEHPGRGPTQRHLAVLPVPHPAGVVANDLDHRLDRVGRLERLVTSEPPREWWTLQSLRRMEHAKPREVSRRAA
jgi:hypothetical protein